MTRAEIIELLNPHLPAGYTEEQRKSKADNLLRKMRKGANIESKVIDGKRVWNHT
jgi:hypothetical protein